ncbi:hypothetical protein M5K25_021662 [Dendrobium thyrsiflorum]|uniref:Uncharacterized protein n=1 Tax=Dendrobium thyrsiflorum TaxID=117978 RepID=A0ABD0UCZ8_DENTH
MSGLSNFFSVLNLDAEDDKEQIAIPNTVSAIDESSGRISALCLFGFLSASSVSYVVSRFPEETLRFSMLAWVSVAVPIPDIWELSCLLGASCLAPRFPAFPCFWLLITGSICAGLLYRELLWGLAVFSMADLWEEEVGFLAGDGDKQNGELTVKRAPSKSHKSHNKILQSSSSSSLSGNYKLPLVWIDLEMTEEGVVVCGFQVILDSGYDGGGCGEGHGLEVEAVERKLLRLVSALRHDLFGLYFSIYTRCGDCCARKPRSAAIVKEDKADSLMCNCCARKKRCAMCEDDKAIYYALRFS